jgi:hypothetical protein
VRVVVVLALGCACSASNSRAGQFYGLWTLEHTSSVDSCNGSSTLTGTLAIDPGLSADLEILMRDWPPCGSGVEANVDGATATGSATCTITGSGSDTDTVAVDLPNLSLTIDSTNQYLSLSGMQTQTDQTGVTCDITLSGSAFKPGVGQ